MQRSCRPSSSHFGAIERTSGGQSRRVASQSRSRPSKRREFQEQMPRLAKLDVGRAGNRRARRARSSGSSRRVQPRTGRRARSGCRSAGRCRRHSGRAGNACRSASRPAGCVRGSMKPAASRRRKSLLRQPPVGVARGAREMIERQAEATIDVGLHRMLARAVVGDRHAGRLGRELDRRAVLVGAAEEQDLVAGLPAKAGVDVGRQQRAGEVAEMLYAVDVGQRAGDQELGSWDLSIVSRADMKKPFAQEGPERPIRLSSARASAFRPVLSKGLAHSRAGKASGVEHRLNIGPQRMRVNGPGSPPWRRRQRDRADGAADELGAGAGDLDVAQRSASARRSCAPTATACCPTGRAAWRSGCCRGR